MKKLLLLSLLCCLGITVLAQQTRVRASEQLLNYGIERPVMQAIDDPVHFLVKKSNPSVKAGLLPSETTIGETRYDLQTNSCTQNRFYRWADGTMGGTWTFGALDPDFADRGTGYNFFDGTSWGPYPTARIEPQRTGWPSYAPLGATGECVLAHTSNDNMAFSSRAVKGVGAWATVDFVAPTGHGYLWPRMITGGTDKNTIHVIALTTPTGNGGTPYNGMDGAVLYSRSLNGGQTWDIQHVQLPGMTSTEYDGIGGDQYAWAEPKGDTIAFLVGDSWMDFFLMKSTDNGTTWTKTTIWQNPYPNHSGTVTDTFYCVDGSMHAAFDADGMAHVVFGVQRAHSDGAGYFWFPYVDGVAYWNESMPPFTSNDFKYTLHPDTLYNSGNLVGWFQDVNQNDTMDLTAGTDAIGKYYVSLSSMPQIAIDDEGYIFLVYSSVTEGKNNSIQDYRHLWGRAWFPDLEEWGEFVHLTGSIVHNFDECVFPSIAARTSENAVHYIYQADEEPGLHIRGDEDPVTDNSIIYAAAPKADFGVGINKRYNPISSVSQNYPNPFSAITEIAVSLDRRTTLSLDVYNMMGQKVYGVNQGNVSAGFHTLRVDGSHLVSGIYFYTVTANGHSMTKKMIVQ